MAWTCDKCGTIYQGDFCPTCYDAAAQPDPSESAKPFTSAEIIALFPLLYDYHAKAESFFGASLLAGIYAGEGTEHDKTQWRNWCNVKIRIRRELTDLDHRIDCVLHPPDGVMAESAREALEAEAARAACPMRREE